jgi:tetratricopeptide (TPR) repeat protein
MKNDRKSIWLILVLTVTGLTACGGASPPDAETTAGKIPITTESEQALSAYLKGRQLVDDLRFTDAHQFFVDSVEADPDFALGHLGVANTSSTAQAFFDAMRRAVETSDTASDGEKMQIRAFEAGVNGEPGIQRAQLEALTAAFPNDERAHNALAIFLFGQQEYDAAIEEYRAAIDVNPNFAPPYNQLGYALRTVGDFAGAEKAFQKYTELIPDQPNPYDSYAELLMKMGRFEESIAKYEKALEIDPNFVASYVGISNDQMFLGDTVAARETLATLEEVARTDGERRQACTWAAASYLHENDFDGALAEIQRRYDIAAETDDRSAMSGDLNLMGDILLRAGRGDQAIEKYEASIDMMLASDATDDVKKATERNILFDLARVALWKGNLEDASVLASDYGEAVAEHYIRFEVRQSHELDGMVALAEGNIATAFEELAQANQQNPQVLLLTARAHAAAKDSEAARQVCQQVIDFNQLNFNLAYVRITARQMLEEL